MLLISFQDGFPIEVPAPAGPSRRSRLISLPGGGVAALREVRVKGLSGAEPEALEYLRRLAAGDPRALRRPLAAAATGDWLVVLAEAPGGPSLRTVLRLVPLTWEQAAVLGEGLLAALGQLQAQALVHGGITSDSAVLCPDGRVRLIDPAPMPPSDPAAATGDDSRHASRILSELLEAVSDPSRRSVSAALPAALLQVAAGMDREGTPAAQCLDSWRRLVRARLGRQGRAGVVRQLTALATRLPGGLTAVEAAGQEPAAAVAATGEAWAAAAPEGPAHLALTPAEVAHPEPRRPPPGPRPNRRRGRLAAGLVVALLAVGGGTLLATRGGPQPPRHHLAPSRLGSPSPPTTPTPIPSPTAAVAPTPSPSSAQSPGQLRPIPTLAPRSNPPVDQVQLEAGCTTTGTQGCQVTLTVSLGQHAPLTVAWEVEEVDRCDGAVTTVASGQIPAPANYTYVQAQPQVNPPPGQPVALVGLAGAPGQAASLPLSIIPPGAQCPG